MAVYGTRVAISGARSKLHPRRKREHERHVEKLLGPHHRNRHGSRRVGLPRSGRRRGRGRIANLALQRHVHIGNRIPGSELNLDIEVKKVGFGAERKISAGPFETRWIRLPMWMGRVRSSIP